MSEIIIKKVSTKKEMKDFIRFNYELYKNCPYAVPDFYEDTRDTFDPKKNAAFEFCEADFFLAYRDGRLAGRIAVIINHKANNTWNVKNARFGWIDFIDDQEVSAALLHKAEEWGRERGMDKLVGPLGFTDMDPEGMLTDGYDQLSTMSTIYNYPYYPKHMERMGFEKDQDWHEFKIFVPREGIPEKHQRIGEIVRKKYGLSIRKFKNEKEIMPYARKVFRTLNAAYEPLYGFSPLTDKQIDYYIKMYIPMLRYDLVTVITRDADDEVVGFGISLPSLSKAMQKARGHLFPFGWIHLLKALKSKPKVIDLYLTGVLPEYQSKGVNALLFNDLIPVYNRLGVVYAESNPELENNNAVQAQWNYFKREHHKTRRAFIKKIDN